MGTGLNTRLPDALGTAALALCVSVILGTSGALSVIAGSLGLLMGLIFLPGGVRFARALAGSFGVGGIVVFGLSRLTPSFNLSELSILASLVVIVVALYTLLLRDTSVSLAARHLALPSFLLTAAFWSFRTISPDRALARLAGDYAEDNGAWLLALSRSVRGEETVLNLASNTSGGPSTGWGLTITRMLSRHIGSSSLEGLEFNGTILLRAYLLIGVLACLVLCVVTVRLARDATGVLVFIVPVLTTAVFLPFLLSLVKVGHFSALVAVLALASALDFATTETKGRTARVASSVVVVLMLVAAGQAWYPLTGVAVLYAALKILSAAFQWWKKPDRVGRPWLLGTVVVLITITGIAAIRELFPTYFANITDVNYLLDNLRMVGGYAPVNSLLAVSAFVGCLVLVSTRWAKYQDFTYLILSLLGPLTVLLVISYAMKPNTPQYGALKYMFILASLLVPLATTSLVAEFAHLIPARLLPLTGLALVSAVMMFAPPANELTWLSKPGPRENEWSRAVIQEVRRGGTVVCLNSTQGDTGRDYEAYLCTRIASSLAGTDTYETRTWTAANICQIPLEQARAAFSDDFQKQLSVVLFDGRRSTSGAGCQSPNGPIVGGWTSVIDWTSTRTVSPDGSLASVDGRTSDQER
jgi:hypothetical protein